MGSKKKSSGKKPSKSSGRGKKTNKNSKHKQGGKATNTPAASTVVESGEPKPEPSSVNTEGQSECASHPGDQAETCSSEHAQSRRRSCSVPGFIAMDDDSDNTVERNTRTTEILLLRRQAVSRLSEPDRPSEDQIQSLSVNSFHPKSPSSVPEEHLETEELSDTMYETTNLMDYVENKPPKKTNKNKNKNKNRKLNKAKAKEAATLETPTSEVQSEGPSSSKSLDTAELKTSEEEAIDQEQKAVSGLTSSMDGLDVEDNSAEEDCKGKGKQRVDSVENESSSKGAEQPETSPEKSTGKAAAKQPKAPEPTDTKPSSSSQKSSRKPSKGKLPAIKEGEVQEDIATEPAIPDCTPKSAGTASSTGSTPGSNAGPQISPQTTAPPTTHRNKSAQATGSPKTTDPAESASASAASSPSTSSSKTPTPTPKSSAHAHPTPKPKLRSLADLKSYKPANFVWQLDSHGFPCGLPNCSARCNLWDGATVICPKCGPYSETRYCSREHLFQDIKRHWPVCGNDVFKHPCKESTIPRDVREASPLVPCLHGYDTPERFRQAVHFTMNHREGDYFIFSDWEDLAAAKFPKENLKHRCSSKIIHVVKFEDGEKRDRFRRVLAAVLFVTIETPDLTDYMYRLLRDSIRASTGTTTTNPSDVHSLNASLRYQLFREVAITIQPSITGERHACPTDWTGRNRRTCSDEVCRSEETRLLGKRGGGGHKALIEELESEYWILRSARVTHPTVQNAVRRMCGEGYGEDVAEEDRREFCRGDGWDGAGAGEMEIEGVNA
ncbi:hypothetical protein BDV18DRAFT_158479 [Aspergillus unguis]